MATPTSEGTPRAEDRSQKKAAQRQSGGWLDTFLNGVEAVGNKLPEPFTIFLILYVTLVEFIEIKEDSMLGSGQFGQLF